MVIGIDIVSPSAVCSAIKLGKVLESEQDFAHAKNTSVGILL